ncbi:MAG TPA: transporter substrate-binding protein [Lacunisphaera sp.]|nr:transporter substrate-binding protein [Lacunisphaera sp.]
MPSVISKALGLGVAIVVASIPDLRAADGPVKVGVLHSLSGTMAASETPLRDVMLFAFDEINSSGGILGRRVEPIVLDGASNVGLFAEKAKRLLERDKVAAIFGCWTSASRKAVVPIMEEHNGLLFYSVQYEGEEESRNVCYTGETLNQQVITAVDYLLGKGYRRFFLIGSDYIYPHTTNLVVTEYLLGKGITPEQIGGGIRRDETGRITSAGTYTPLGHADYERIVSAIKLFAAQGRACVINTLNGDTNHAFFKEYAAAGLTPANCPVMSFSIAENGLRLLPRRVLAGQLGCWAYFQSLDVVANARFLESYGNWRRTTSRAVIAKGPWAVESPAVLSYDAVYLWKACVEKAGSFAVDRVREAWQSGISFDGPGGRVNTQPNMQLTKTVFVGQSRADGQFTILARYPNIAGDPWWSSKEDVGAGTAGK